MGYNLLVFIYQKEDKARNCRLRFTDCSFIDKRRTGDYKVTAHLREMVEGQVTEEELSTYLGEIGIGDDEELNALAQRILKEPPDQGYLSLSSALQWRLHYVRALKVDNKVAGIRNYVLERRIR